MRLRSTPRCDHTVVTFVHGRGVDVEVVRKHDECGRGAAVRVRASVQPINGNSVGNGSLNPFRRVPIIRPGSGTRSSKGTSESVAVGAQDGRALAYYKSADGISVLAPRGWYCQGVSGSGGAALFLSPRPVVHSSSGWEGLSGAAIEVNDISGENSGRYEIAELVARVFPAYQSFARRVWDLDSPLPSRPYPKDALTYRGKTVVDYRTPAQTEGLGNFHSWLGKNDLPIAGAAILLMEPNHHVGDVPHLVLLSVRFPPDLSRLAPTIIRYVEREIVAANGK
jgi:hypothetical protein